MTDAKTLGAAATALETIKRRWRDPVIGWLTKEDFEHAPRDIEHLLANIEQAEADLAEARRLLDELLILWEKVTQDSRQLSSSPEVQKARTFLARTDTQEER